MAVNSFFEESTRASLIKAEIVLKYFRAWARILISNKKKISSDFRIAYLDLFAGQGIYDDGTVSTPILVLEEAIKDPDLRQHLFIRFNDKNKRFVDSLIQSVEILPGVNSLNCKPRISNDEVGQEMVEELNSIHDVPSLVFLDPWGYKGLSMALIRAAIRNWGCDCVFFFNYNRINMDLDNPRAEKHVEAFFGKSRLNQLRKRVMGLSPLKREETIMAELQEALIQLGSNYVLSYRFKSDQSSRTSHYLLFVCKNFTGYKIMKDIMAKASSSKQQGVASFENDPRANLQQPTLFPLEQPLDELKEMLLDNFAERILKAKEIFEQHSVNRPYVQGNYKQALIELDEEGRITAPRQNRNTLGDNVLVTFPMKKRVMHE